MDLQHFVIHRIDKLANAAPTVTLGATLLPVTDERVRKFATEAADVLSRKEGKPRCVFAPFNADGVKYPFSTRCREYFDGARDLLSVSGDATNDLARCMTGKSATGGYVVFAGYRDPEGVRHLLVVMLHQQKGFTVDDRTLELLDVNHLEMRQVDKAATINGGLPGGTMPARPLIYAGFRKSLSQYFQEFLGPDRHRDPSRDTLEFVDVVEKFCDQEKVPPARRDEIRAGLQELAAARDTANEDIDLEAAAAIVLPAESEKFVAFAQAQQTSASFSPDPGVFDRWGVIKFRSDDHWVVQFPKSALYNNLVYFDPQERTLLIRHVDEKLVEQILAALNQSS